MTGNGLRGSRPWSLDTPFWQNHFLTTDGQDLHGWAEKRKAMLGQAKLALCFQIPSQASLHGILKPHRPFCYANGPTLAPRSEILGKKHRVALGFQAGMCFEKASASPLVSVFFTTNPAFAQRINPYFLSFYPCISW